MICVVNLVCLIWELYILIFVIFFTFWCVSMYCYSRSVVAQIDWQKIKTFLVVLFFNSINDSIYILSLILKYTLSEVLDTTLFPHTNKHQITHTYFSDRILTVNMYCTACTDSFSSNDSSQSNYVLLGVHLQ